MQTSDLFLGRAARIVLLASASCICAGQAARADNCLARPNHAATAGGHWYYRVDRAHHRRCWELRVVTTSSTAVLQPGGAAADAGAGAGLSGTRSEEAPTSATTDDAPGLMGWLSSLVGGAGRPNSTPPATADNPDLDQAAPTRPPKRAAKVRHPRAATATFKKTKRVAAARPDASSEEAAPPLDQAKRGALFQEFQRWRKQHSYGLGAVESAQD